MNFLFLLPRTTTAGVRALDDLDATTPALEEEPNNEFAVALASAISLSELEVFPGNTADFLPVDRFDARPPALEAEPEREVRAAVASFISLSIQEGPGLLLIPPSLFLVFFLRSLSSDSDATEPPPPKTTLPSAELDAPPSDSHEEAAPDPEASQSEFAIASGKKVVSNCC